ncbi:MAG: nitroreductase family protein [Chloroflexia bacterium]|nr:nitroreductase family protein [Chloroflexia bacterium]
MIDHALRTLRGGDYRDAMNIATGQEPAIVMAPAIIVTTSTFWRNAWRYQARAYRHVYWETGTVLGNLLAVAADSQLPARPVLGFVDADINALLGVDGEREAAISLVAWGRTAARAPGSLPVPPLALETEPISAGEIEFPEIGAMHAASSLASPAEVATWREPSLEPSAGGGHTGAIPLRPIPAGQVPAETIDDVIDRRRSFRKYDTATALSFATFSTVLERSGRAVRFDGTKTDDAALTSRYLLVNRVDEIDPGNYAVSADASSLTLIQAGDVSTLAFELACFQEYAGETHVNVYEMADLDRALRRFGNRGYRVAQLEAAIAGAKLQLAAHALDLGAVGSTSLDDRVTAALAPGTEDLSFMFVAVFGERRRPIA